MADEIRKRGRPKKQPQQEFNYSQQQQNEDITSDSDFNDNFNEQEDFSQRFDSRRFQNINRSMSDSRRMVDNDDDDLKSFLKKKKISNNSNMQNQSSNVDIDEETLRDIEEFENSDGLNDIPNEEYNPLNEAVQKRAYTGGMVGNNGSNVPPRNERIIEEPNYKSNGANKLEVDKDLLNPNNDIPKDNNTKQNSGDKKQKQENTKSESSSNNNDTGEKVNGEENVKELTPQEKREAMEKTADAILLAYRTYVPMPFVYASTYSDKKLQDLHNKNQINLETEIKRDGTTFRQYYKEFNEKVEQTFVVTDAEVEAIKDPLVDVLMEKQVAFTPTQRLMFTVGQLIVAKTMTAVKFYMEKQSDIEEMKNIHKEKIKMQEEIIDKLDKQEEQRQREESKRKENEDRIRKMEEQIIREREQARAEQEQVEQEIEEDEYDDGTTNQPQMNVIRNDEQEVTEDKIEEVKEEEEEEEEEPKKDENTISTAPTLDDFIDNYDDEEINDIPE